MEHLTKHFTKKSIFGSEQTSVIAADDVSFSLKRGEVFVLAGESGSGKSTIAKIILQSINQDSGSVMFEGHNIADNPQNLASLRMGCQMIHQDPYDSINPRMRIGDIVSEPLEIHRIGDGHTRRQRVLEVLQEVKLEPVSEIVKKYPHMLSGGQRQRVVLARALATRPRVILADEPVSMLDVSIRAEVLELMHYLLQKHGISFVYITHDLATARYFGHRIGILYMGRIVEMGPIDDVLFSPRHPYTQALVDALPEPDPANLERRRDVRIKDTINEQHASGCIFRNRCIYEVKQCSEEPRLRECGSQHHVACHVDLD